MSLILLLTRKTESQRTCRDEKTPDIDSYYVRFLRCDPLALMS